MAHNGMGDYIDVGNLQCCNSLGSQAAAVVINDTSRLAVFHVYAIHIIKKINIAVLIYLGYPERYTMLCCVVKYIRRFVQL